MKIKQIAENCWCEHLGEVHHDETGAFEFVDRNTMEDRIATYSALLQAPLDDGEFVPLTQAETIDLLPDMTQEAIDAEIGQAEYKAEKEV